MALPAAARDLPVVDVLPQLAAALEHHGSALLVAPPGAGKTTIAPLWLIEQDWLGGRIVMLEPRRLATRAAAQRMAALLGTEVGGLVGYQTRDERRIGRTRGSRSSPKASSPDGCSTTRSCPVWEW